MANCGTGSLTQHFDTDRSLQVSTRRLLFALGFQEDKHSPSQNRIAKLLRLRQELVVRGQRRPIKGEHFRRGSCQVALLHLKAIIEGLFSSLQCMVFGPAMHCMIFFCWPIRQTCYVYVGMLPLLVLVADPYKSSLATATGRPNIYV